MHSSTQSAITNSYMQQYQTNSSNLGQQNQIIMNSVAQPTINLMPAVSYSSLPVCSSATVLAPSIVQQHQQPPPQQQPVLFSGTNGNFFLAHSTPIGSLPLATPIVGNPSSLVLASGQGNPNTFVLAQPLPQMHSAATAPANCIIRLPDGRLVMQANSPTTLGLQPTNLTHLNIPQSAYFPIPMSSTNATSSNAGSLSMTPHLTPSPGQAFYIHMPPNSLNVCNSVLTTRPTAGANFQSISNTNLKPTPQLSFVNSPLNMLPSRPGSLITNPVGINHSQLAARQPSFTTAQHRSVSASITSTASSATVLNHPSNLLVPAVGGPTTQLLETQLVQNQAKLETIGVNPSHFANIQPVPSGVAVARLPNGTFTTLAFSTPGVSSSFPISGIAATPVTSTVFQSPTTAQPVSTRKSTPSGRGRAKNLCSPPPDTADVLRRLDDQINALQRVATPTESQLNRLKQLLEVKHQLALSTNTNTHSSINRATPNRRSSNTGCVQITPSLRRELLDILASHNLLPQPNTGSSQETFIVEFRLNQQRYQLRLTRTQKIEMERLLFSITSQRQAEILTVFQQEQSRLNNSGTQAKLPVPTTSGPGPAITATTSNSVVGFTVPSHPTRLQSSIQTYTAASPLPVHTFPAASGLRLVATRPVMQATALPGTIMRPVVSPIGSTAPVMGVVAMAMPSVGTSCISSTMYTPNLPLNPTPINAQAVASSLSCTPTMVPNVGVTNALFTMPLPPTCFGSTVNGTQNLGFSQSSYLNSTGFSAYSAAQTRPFSVPPAPSNLVNTVRPIALTIQQATRLTRLRSYLSNDLKVVSERPPPVEAKENNVRSNSTAIDLLEYLAPYHVLCDRDNTDEAMAKVDEVLENSMNILLRKKLETIQTVEALLFKESLHQFNPFYEDRLLTANMSLDLERDLLQTEKDIFAQVTNESCATTSTTAIVNELRSSSLNFIPDVVASSSMNVILKSETDAKRRFNTNCLPVLKYESSLLPEPWPALLGSLANLRPLIFDKNGGTSFAHIDLPPYVHPADTKPSSDDGEANNSPKHNSTDLNNHSNNFEAKLETPILPIDVLNSMDGDDDDEINDVSSDEAEADRLLGLDTTISRVKLSEKHVSSNGMLDEADCGSANRLKSSSGCVEFDEAYDFWQELMHGESIGMTDNATSVLDNSLDSETMALLHDEPPNKSSRLLDSGQSYMGTTVQHSEDPDIDAAIRSILSTSD